MDKFTKLAIENNYQIYYRGLFTGLTIAFLALVYFTIVGKL